MTPTDQIALPPNGKHREVRLGDDGTHADQVHLLTEREISAINTAIAAGRPLLVRGEPGTGKSQLARAAARELKRAFVQQVIDSHAEARDLLWTFDAVKRLADAQLAGSLRHKKFGQLNPLKVENYLHPGPLWWAFDWEGAARQCERVGACPPPQPAECRWENGCVLLLDEIDKAESELPNGLLEALGARSFTPFGRNAPVRAGDKPPLTVITSNEERALPDAFVRRCLVLRLAMPEPPELIERGRAHFPKADQTVLDKAADLLFCDREAARAAQVRPFPGQAEYLDMLRAVTHLKPGDPVAQCGLLDVVARYVLKKYAGIEETGYSN